jgi:hypothetical protein
MANFVENAGGFSTPFLAEQTEARQEFFNF